MSREIKIDFDKFPELQENEWEFKCFDSGYVATKDMEPMLVWKYKSPRMSNFETTYSISKENEKYVLNKKSLLVEEAYYVGLQKAEFDGVHEFLSLYRDSLYKNLKNIIVENNHIDNVDKKKIDINLKELSIKIISEL